MILVDTSVWVEHLRNGLPGLVGMLGKDPVLIHPFVLGEVALGNLRRRGDVLTALADLPQIRIATDEEVSLFIERHQLFGLGIGYVDAHLLAAVFLMPGTRLWTLDKRLARVAEKLGCAR